MLFDLDDTLFDQMLFLKGAFRAAAISGAPDAPAAVTESLAAAMVAVVRARGTGGGRVFEEALERLGIPTDAGRVARMACAFRAYAPRRLEPAPGVVSTLEALAARWPLGLVTDGEVPTQQTKLRALGLAHYFAVVVFADAIGGPATRKPSPAPYEAALAGLRTRGAPGVQAERAVYVGDNPERDLAGARALGMLTVRVLTGEHARTTAAAGDEPDYVVGTVAGLVELLR